MSVGLITPIPRYLYNQIDYTTGTRLRRQRWLLHVLPRQEFCGLLRSIYLTLARSRFNLSKNVLAVDSLFRIWRP